MLVGGASCSGVSGVTWHFHTALVGRPQGVDRPHQSHKIYLQNPASVHCLLRSVARFCRRTSHDYDDESGVNTRRPSATSGSTQSDPDERTVAPFTKSLKILRDKTRPQNASTCTCTCNERHYTFLYKYSCVAG